MSIPNAITTYEIWIWSQNSQTIGFLLTCSPNIRPTPSVRRPDRHTYLSFSCACFWKASYAFVLFISFARKQTPWAILRVDQTHKCAQGDVYCMLWGTALKCNLQWDAMCVVLETRSDTEDILERTGKRPRHVHVILIHTNIAWMRLTRHSLVIHAKHLINKYAYFNKVS